MKIKRNTKIFILLLLLILIPFSYKFINDYNNNHQLNDISEYIDYHFRNDELLNDHYQKHGIEMGYNSPLEYEKAASNIANNPNAFHKLEKEDNDHVYFLDETNEIVFISNDGYIRTYFISNSGKNYFNAQ